MEILIEKEIVGKNTIFIASSKDINVFAEGKTIEEAIKRFVSGLLYHLKTFPEEREKLLSEN